MTDQTARYENLRRQYVAIERTLETATVDTQDAICQRLDDLAGPLEEAHRLVTGDTEIDLW